MKIDCNYSIITSVILNCDIICKGWMDFFFSEFNLKFDTRNIYIIVSKCNENVSSLSEANINSGFGRKIEPRIFFNFCFEMKERNIKF